MSCNVKVAVRVRPLSGAERARSEGECIRFPNENQVLIGKRPFTFDKLFRQSSTQHEMYSECVENLVDQFIKGYNATVLAYGQTGSGKTFTMGTASTRNIAEHELGLVPRVVDGIFRRVQETSKAGTNIGIKVSFLEIYKEQINDLLKSGDGNTKPSIRENSDGGIRVDGVVEEQVTCKTEMLSCLNRGSLARATASTRMNVHSSRSHAIFTIHVTQTCPNTLEDKKTSKTSAASKNPSASGESDAKRSEKSDVKHSEKSVTQTSDANGTDEDQEEEEPEIPLVEDVITSKFHFVDLAGSERLKKTMAEGERLKEGININSGLLALGNVISALGDPKRRAAHVPFRDSRITRILQDSLGGNSQTLMIACVSPAEGSLEETVNTLKYANRAKNIENKPIVNRDPIAERLKNQKRRIAELEALLLKTGRMNAFQFEIGEEEMEALNKQVEVTTAENEILQEKLSTMRRRIEEITSRCLHLETERDYYREQSQRLCDRDKSNTQDQQQKVASQPIPPVDGGANAIAGNKAVDTHSATVAEIEDRQKMGPQISEATSKNERMSEIFNYLKTIANLEETIKNQSEQLETQSTELAQLRGGMKRLRTKSVGDEDSPRSPSSRSPGKRVVDLHARSHSYDEKNLVGKTILNGKPGSEDIATSSGQEIVDLIEEKDLRERKMKMEEFEKRMNLYEARSKDLDSEIREKEQEKNGLMKQLMTIRSRAKEMQKNYEVKIQQLESAIRMVQEDHDKTLHELSKKEGAIEEEKSKIEKAYEKKLRMMKGDLEKLNHTKREHARLMRDRTKDEIRIRRLEEFINSSKQERQDLKRKIAESKHARSKLMKQNMIEQRNLIKLAQKKDRLVADLERKIQQQNIALDRRTTEKKNLHEKLKLYTRRMQSRGYTKLSSVTRDKIDSEIRAAVDFEKIRTRLASTVKRRDAAMKEIAMIESEEKNADAVETVRERRDYCTELIINLQKQMVRPANAVGRIDKSLFRRIPTLQKHRQQDEAILFLIKRMAKTQASIGNTVINATAAMVANNAPSPPTARKEKDESHRKDVGSPSVPTLLEPLDRKIGATRKIQNNKSPPSRLPLHQVPVRRDPLPLLTPPRKKVVVPPGPASSDPKKRVKKELVKLRSDPEERARLNERIRKMRLLKNLELRDMRTRNKSASNKKSRFGVRS
mmetsp:Transcript_21755/g.43665  ORF Transcript_21755/g.43665 Transcript_21755/m.43665 type:complete len:1173 (-) Transcript_21755:258-3776(-)